MQETNRGAMRVDAMLVVRVVGTRREKTLRGGRRDGDREMIAEMEVDEMGRDRSLGGLQPCFLPGS